MSTEFSCTNLKLTNSKQFCNEPAIRSLLTYSTLYLHSCSCLFSIRSLLTYCTLYLHSCTNLSVLCTFLTRIILEYNNTLAATCFERKLAGREKRTIAIQTSQLEALDLKKNLHFLFA